MGPYGLNMGPGRAHKVREIIFEINFLLKRKLHELETDLFNLNLDIKNNSIHTRSTTKHSAAVQNAEN